MTLSLSLSFRPTKSLALIGGGFFFSSAFFSDWLLLWSEDARASAGWSSSSSSVWAWASVWAARMTWRRSRRQVAQTPMSLVESEMATTTHITLIIHHRGRLERGSDGKLCYAECEITEVERVTVDTLNGFFISDLLKDIGYPIISDFYWRQPGMEIEGGLRLLRLDMDVVKMYEAAVENGHKIELYTEHPISQADVVDTNEEDGVEAPDHVNVTPSRRRKKVCVRRTPTPKKAIGPRRILHLEGVHIEDQITEETHGTEKAQPDASPNPSVPATPNTVHVSEESATPNTVHVYEESA